MIQLLIVDDESATRNGLLRHIDWKSLGIGMIQTAGSAQEALALCDSYRPDIVLSDIRMRGMNGVEMCTALQSRFPDLQIIFISGYSDKEYLKAAIALRAVDYVEKPVNAAVLRETAAKAVAYCREIRERAKQGERLSQSAAYLRRELLFALLQGRAEDVDDLPQRLEEAGLSTDWPATRAGLLLASGPVTNIDRFLQSLEAALSEDCGSNCWNELREFQDNRSMVLVLQGSASAVGDGGYALRRWERVLESGIEGVRLYLGLGPPVQDIQSLSRSWQGALAASEALFFEDYGHLRTRERREKQVRLDAAAPDAFEDAIRGGDSRRAAELLRGLEEQLRAVEAGKGGYVNNIYFSIATRIQQQYGRLFPQDSAAEAVRRREYQRMEDARTLRELTAILMEQVDHLIAAGGREEQGNLAVTKVIRMIGKRYGDANLSVRELADGVYLTPTYLSSLFKRRTGKTIGEYITEVRMEKAVKLLADGSLKLYQVASQVGYEDANYFAKIFKKHVGQSPSAFRDTL